MFFAAILNYELVNTSNNGDIFIDIFTTPVPGSTLEFENGLDTDGFTVTPKNFSGSQYLYIERVLQLTANLSNLPAVTEINIMIIARDGMDFSILSESDATAVINVIPVTGNL